MAARGDDPYIARHPEGRAVTAYSAGLALADMTAWEPGLLTLGWGDLRGGIDGVDVPLQARALVLQRGEERLALVTVDLCFVTELLRDEVLERLAARPALGITPRALLLTATHTHAGPSGLLRWIRAPRWLAISTTFVSATSSSHRPATEHGRKVVVQGTLGRGVPAGCSRRTRHHRRHVT